MLLGPPCAWPDQWRENGLSCGDSWRDGSCNHYTVQQEPSIDGLVCCLDSTWYFYDTFQLWLCLDCGALKHQTWRTFMQMMSQEGACHREGVVGAARHVFAGEPCGFFDFSLPTQKVIIRMKSWSSRLITLIPSLNSAAFLPATKVQEFQIIFAKEIDRYLAKLASRGKTSAGWQSNWEDTERFNMQRQTQILKNDPSKTELKWNCETQTWDVLKFSYMFSWFYNLAMCSLFQMLPCSVRENFWIPPVPSAFCSRGRDEQPHLPELKRLAHQMGETWFQMLQQCRLVHGNADLTL